MILSVSPYETLQYVVQFIYTSYTSNQSQMCMSFTNSSCNTNATNTAVGSMSSNANLKSQQQCMSYVQLISQAIHLMGSQFPLNKKINLNQNANLRSPKPIFNMFLPVMFVGHTHCNGAIILQNQHIQSNQSSVQQQANLDYEKLLLDSYVPYLTFFDWLCRNTFNRRLTTENNAGNSSSSSSNSTGAASAATNTPNQTTKHIVDLILIVSQQSILLNVSFISYLNNFLTNNEAAEDRGTFFSFGHSQGWITHGDFLKKKVILRKFMISYVKLCKIY